jgi:hypothetical protein
MNSMKIQEHGSFRLPGLGGEAEEEKKKWECEVMGNDKPGFYIMVCVCVAPNLNRQTTRLSTFKYVKG